METRAHHVLIGLFSVLVIVGAMLFGLWLAKASMDSTFKDYEVVFNEAVSGLSKGSSVQYNGIKVGDVIELRLDDKDPRRVLARIRLAAGTPVKVDTKAKLALTGVTGTSIIQLSGGDPNSPVLKGVDGKLPVIVASPSPIARLLTDGNDLLANINILLHNANRLFSRENVNRVGKTLDNLEQAFSGKRETVEDVAHHLERWVDGIMIRTFGHDNVIRLAQAASVPVINALTDLLHPCQAMADFFTLKEHKGNISKIKLAWVGDGNNVCHSLMFAAAKAGCKMSAAVPKGYEPNPEIVRLALEDGKGSDFELIVTNDPLEAVAGADAIYADVWTSMGQEAEKEERLKLFASFQVNEALMSKAKDDCVFMHCLPAHRGEEVTAEVFDGPRSIVFDEAENRLHAQKAIMLALMGK